MAPSPAEVAAHLIDLVRRVHPSAEVAVTVARETVALTRFAESFIHQNVADEADRVLLQLHVDGRTATAHGNGTSRDALTRLVESTLTAAALAKTTNVELKT